jgi:hypothetical protein
MSKRLGLAVRLGLFAAGMTLAIGSVMADNVLPTVVVRGVRIHYSSPQGYGWLWDTSSQQWDWGWVPDEQGNGGGSDGLEPPTEQPPDNPTTGCDALRILQADNQCGAGPNSWHDPDSQCSGTSSFMMADFSFSCESFDMCSNGGFGHLPWDGGTYNDCQGVMSREIFGSCRDGYYEYRDALRDAGVDVTNFAPAETSGWVADCVAYGEQNVAPSNSRIEEFNDRRHNGICSSLGAMLRDQQCH